MKVLMFGWEFPPHISGGLGTACYGLTKGMITKGMDVTFVVPKAYGDESNNAVKMVGANNQKVSISEEEYELFWEKIKTIGISSYLVPYLSPEEFKLYTSSIEEQTQRIRASVFDQSFTFSGKYGKDLIEEVARYALVAGKIANNENHDVIHTHDWMTFPAGITAKKTSKKPLVIHVHATEFDRSGEHVNQQVFDIERNGMQNADKIIAVSNRTRNTIIQRYGIAEDKVTTIHNAIIPSKPSIPIDHPIQKEDKIVTFLGRITFQKGPDYFVEVASKVLSRMGNVRFVMAGSGDMMEKMITLAAKKRIGNKFHFTGFLKGDEVRKMYSMSDVYVMPSVSEPFGISPLEAMQANVPVIISKQSGVSEILKHAIKVDFWDTEATANAIYALLNYKGIAQLFKQNGKKEIETLKWETAANKVKNLYETLL